MLLRHPLGKIHSLSASSAATCQRKQPVKGAKQSFAERHSQAEIERVRELRAQKSSIYGHRRIRTYDETIRAPRIASKTFARKGLSNIRIPGHPQAELGNEGRQRGARLVEAYFFWVEP